MAPRWKGPSGLRRTPLFTPDAAAEPRHLRRVTVDVSVKLGVDSLDIVRLSLFIQLVKLHKGFNKTLHDVRYQLAGFTTFHIAVIPLHDIILQTLGAPRLNFFLPDSH